MSVSPTSVKRGTTARLNVSVKSSVSRTALINIDVYAANGTKVYQTFYDNIAFTANVSRQFQAKWAVPSSLAAGTYTVRIGVFSSGWGSMLHWNNQGFTFVVRN